MEIEAKFSIPDEQTFGGLLEMATLAGFDLGEASVTDLHDRYLDTADWAIRAWGYAYRMRRSDDHYVATLKGLGGALGAVHRRIEHNVELVEPLPPQAWPPSSARDLALRLSGHEPLVVLFEVEQVRHCRLLYDMDRVVAEFNLDRVCIFLGEARRQAVPYLEVEVELMPDGSEEDLEKVAIELQETWGLAPEDRSKYQRGMALLEVDRASGEQAEEGQGERLTREERATIERLTQEREVIARRARLLLAWDDGLPRVEMIQKSGLSPRRARHWLSAFAQNRLGIFPDRVLEAGDGGGLASPATRPEEPAPTQAESERAAAAHLALLERTGDEEPPPVVVPAKVEAAPPFSPERVELPEEPGIEPDDPMAEAGRKTFRFHYRRMVFHEPGTRLGEDIEALHDMRVATRRMRAAFRVFEDYYDARAVASYRKGLKRTGRALGAVRDLDVFRAKVEAYLDTLPESQRGSLDDLLAVLEAQREAVRERMITYLDGKKYWRFVERFGEFVETEGMASLPMAPEGDQPRAYRVRHVAPMAIYERLAAVRAYDEWVSIPAPPLTRLHALRIAAKRLRYSLEFFREVLGPDTKAGIKAVVALQDHLGDLQDAVVASGILRDFLIWGTWGHDPAGKRPADLEAPVIAPGVAAYLAAKQAELQHLLATFPQAWQHLKGTEFSRMIAEAVAVL